MSDSEESPRHRKAKMKPSSGEPSLKWRPNDPDDDTPRGKAAKARAKELRKAAEQRREKRGEKRQERQEKQQKRPQSMPLRPVDLSSTPSGLESTHAEPQPSPRVGSDTSGSTPVADLFNKLPTEVWLKLLHLLGATDLCACACVCSGLDSLIAADDVWLDLHERVFNQRPDGEVQPQRSPAPPSSPTPPPPLPETRSTPPTSPLPPTLPMPPAPPTAASAGAFRARLTSFRLRLRESEKALDEWRFAAQPSQLVLPGMTSVCLAGGLGVSTHDGGLLRLWEADSGRRLACSRRLKHAATCCHASEDGMVLLGDAAGLVYCFRADLGLERPLCSAFDASSAADVPPSGIASVLVTPCPGLADSRGLMISGRDDGVRVARVKPARCGLRAICRLRVCIPLSAGCVRILSLRAVRRPGCVSLRLARA